MEMKPFKVGEWITSPYGGPVRIVATVIIGSDARDVPSAPCEEWGDGVTERLITRELFDGLVGRAEAAEESLRRYAVRLAAINRYAVKQRDRAVAAETRLAERDASFNRLRWRP